MEKPALIVLQGPSPTREGFDNAISDGFSSLWSAFSQAVDLVPHDPAELRQYLGFRRAIAHRARKRAQWFGGRLYNRLSGDDPDYVELSGIHLRQTLSICGLKAPDVVVASGHYKLRVDYVDRALDQLAEQCSDA